MKPAPSAAAVSVEPAGVPPATALIRHDEQWFDGIFRGHAKAIHLYFQRRAATSDAEDLAAEVFVTAWRRRDTVVDGMELAWLYRVAGFVLANYRRRQHTTATEHLDALVQNHPTGVTLGSTDTADPALAVAERDRALRSLAALSCRDREIIELAAWEGLSRQELADYLGVSVGGADAALSRARQRLTDAWQHTD